MKIWISGLEKESLAFIVGSFKAKVTEFVFHPFEIKIAAFEMQLLDFISKDFLELKFIRVIAKIEIYK